MDWTAVDIFVKVLAVIVGAVWVLINYVRGRTHKARLQLRVSVERPSHAGLEYLVIRTELKNVGLSRVNIVSDACSLGVYMHQLPQSLAGVMTPRWKELGFFDLYNDQQCVEPNGLLIDQQLIALPDIAAKFVKVWAHVESAAIAWNAYVIEGASVKQDKKRLET